MASTPNSKEKDEIGSSIEEQKKEDEDQLKANDNKPVKDSTFVLILISIITIALLLVFLPTWLSNGKNNKDLSLDDLQELNLKGMLTPDKGYIYKGKYSFVHFLGSWYTVLSTPKGTKTLTIPFHYGPKDVENVSITGVLNTSAFNNAKLIYMTFDPIDDGLQYIGVAIGETNAVLINAFNKGVVPACTNNETTACESRPIINCDNANSPTFYFSNENKTKIEYLNNCVIISGKNQELWRAADRLLFEFLGIMG